MDRVQDGRRRLFARLGALRRRLASFALAAAPEPAPPPGLEAVPLDELVARVQQRVRAAPLPDQARFDGQLERARAGDEHTLAYAVATALAKVRIMRRFAPLEGARVLELGPGYSLVPGLLFHLHGATRYVGVDLYPLAYDAADFYRRLRTLIAAEPLFATPGAVEARRAALARFDALVDLSGERAAFDAARLSIACPVDAAAVPFEDGAFDAILSNAAFEHFERPEAAIRESFRLLRPGGVGLHQIDLRDHRDFSRPLEFLRHSAEEWLALNREYMYSYTNRWRRGDFVRAFERAGFEVLEVEVNARAPFDEALRPQLHPDFRALPREELEDVGIHVAVRRPSER